MRSLWQDLRYAFRTLGRSKGFTAVAVLTLTLGIGANAVVFAIANTTLFKGFPFDKNDRIVYMGTRDLSRTGPYYSDYGPVSYPDFRDWRAQAKSFVDMAAVTFQQTSLSDSDGLPETIRGAQITGNGFQLIGERPLIGRAFTSADDAIGAPAVVMIGYGLWERRYGREPSIIGSSIRLNGIPTTVIGVMPRGFSFPFNGEMWLPLVPRPDFEKRESRNFVVFARLVDGVTLQSARAEMDAIGRNLARAYPLTNQNFASVVQNYNEFYVGPDVTAIFVAMLAGVGFVWLIACADVANLFLARGVSRSREMSIRMALGAGRWRLIRQVGVESLLLSAVAAALGLLIGLAGVRIFDLETIPFGKPLWMVYSMDYRVFAYLVAISIAGGILFGTAPALRLSRLEITAVLKEGGRGASVGRHGRRLADFLVVAEMALAIVLLAGAGLMIRSFLNIYKAPLGLGTTNLLTMRLALPDSRYPKPTDQIAFHDRLKPRLESIPGVDLVAIADFLPTGGSLSFPYELEGVAPPDTVHRPSASTVVISTNYFHALNVGLLAGRTFSESDGLSGPPAVIVNRSFAAKVWPRADPIGKRLRLFDGGAPEAWHTVIGVAPDILQNDISPRQIDPLIYLLYREKPESDMAIIARTNVPPITLGTSFRREIQAVDPDLPIYNLWTLQQRLERNYWYYRVLSGLFVIFAGIALLLASIGLYGVMAHSVGQRSQEIGVRMAMGATGGDVLRLVFVNGMKQVAMGMGIGLIVAFIVMRILKSALIRVSTADPITFGVAATVLIAAGVLGCVIPARRATRVDPVFALRHE